MSDPLTQQLSAASFKGVQFFVRSEEQTDNGRRIVLHEYPNSDTRFVEDLGLVPTKFSVDAFVFGENYQDAQRELESVLNEEGPGQLILPTFGGFEAYALPYTVSAGQTEVGEVKFKLSFALGRPRAGPARGPKD
ncbi:MAG: DNA circularization N-terminal domain-containing protein, partial [Myxococcota bacterium]